VAFGLATVKLGLTFLAGQMIIFALNDNPDPTVAEGGCHWSLVVYSRLASQWIDCTNRISQSNFRLALSHFIDTRSLSNLMIASLVA
jgi:hypothetical protein